MLGGPENCMFTEGNGYKYVRRNAGVNSSFVYTLYIHYTSAYLSRLLSGDD